MSKNEGTHRIGEELLLDITKYIDAYSGMRERQKAKEKPFYRNLSRSHFCKKASDKKYF